MPGTMLFTMIVAFALSISVAVAIGIASLIGAWQANLNFLAFWRYGPDPEALTGVMFVIFAIGIAAAEAAVGLALILAIYRHRRTANLDEIETMKG